jgi:hypothetical protein
VNYAKLLEMNSFFTLHSFLEVGKTQDLPSKFWQTLGDASQASVRFRFRTKARSHSVLRCAMVTANRHGPSCPLGWRCYKSTKELTLSRHRFSIDFPSHVHTSSVVHARDTVKVCSDYEPFKMVHQSIHF